MIRHATRWAILVSLLTACGGTATAPTAPERARVESLDVQAPAIPSSAVEVGGAFLPAMPVAVTSFGAAAADGFLYTLGGYFGTPHDYRPEGQSRALRRVRLDGGSPWEDVAELDIGLQGLALVAHRDRVCRAGGNHIVEPAHLRSIADAACWDPSDGRWTPLPALPRGRSSHGAAVIGDTLYVAGGWQLEGGPESARWHADVLALDLSAREPAWRSIEAPFRRRAVGVAAAGGELVVIGGLTPERQVSRQVDVYDVASGAWSRGPDYPSDAFGVAAVGVGDSVLASARDGVVYRWRPGEPSWTPVATLAFGRFFHQIVDAGDGTVIVAGGIGGMNREGRTRHVERIALTADPERVALFTMPYPGAARNRQAIFLHDDFLYLFGGNNSLEQHDFAPENFESAGWRLHLPSMTWERVADYPLARQTMQTLALDERAISVGGFGTAAGGAAAISHPETYEYDFANDRWAERGGLPRGRTQFGLAAHGEQLWIFGGLNYDPGREAEAFDHVTDVLSAPLGVQDALFEPAGVTLPGPRRAFAGAVLDDRYYLVGGMREGFQVVDDCIAFDFVERAFSSITCPRATRISADLVPLHGRLFVGGGSVLRERAMESARSIEVYDPSADRWTVAVDALPFDTRHARMLVYRDRLLVVTTHRDDGKILLAFVDPPEAP